MKKMVVLTSALMMMSCAGKDIGPDMTRTRLEMVATKSAVGVSFYAKLEGYTNREYKFYCPEQLWEFGDGQSHLHAYKCADYNPNDPWIEKRLFKKFYRYERAGTYRVKLTLMKNGEVVATSQNYVITVDDQ